MNGHGPAISAPRTTRGATSTNGGDALTVPGFALFGGHHCETSAFRKILAHQGLELSEEMLFGLGGGVGFIYWYMKRMPSPFVGGRNGAFPGFLGRAAARAGVTVRVLQTGIAAVGHRRLKEMLRAGQPALVYGDIASLPYSGAAGHFGGHAFVVYAIDERADRVLVSDRSRVACTLTIAELQHARSARFPPFPPKNSLLRITALRPPRDLRPAIREAIADSVRAMSFPPLKAFGLPGLEQWGERVRGWSDQFPGRRLVDCLKDTFVHLELAGTGGAAFRRMYVRFLEEARRHLRDPYLVRAIAGFEAAAESWTRLAESFLPDPVAPLGRMRRLLVRKNECFEAQPADARARMATLSAEIGGLGDEAVRELRTAVPELLERCRRRILECHQREAAAFEELRRIGG